MRSEQAYVLVEMETGDLAEIRNRAALFDRCRYRVEVYMVAAADPVGKSCGCPVL